MLWIKDYFTIYVALLILAIGAYMALVQAPNFKSQDLKREGRFSQIIGYTYLFIGVFGLIICAK